MGSKAGSIGPGTKLGMGQLAKLGEFQALTEMQQKLVRALIEEKPVDEAMAFAGYSDTAPAITIVGSAAVQRAIQAACDAELGGVVRIKALRAMKSMLGDDTPAATRFQAAKWVLERGQDDDQGDDKPMSAMTADELAQLVDRLERERTERNAQIKDVTPRNGA